jgi:hypothetical protein
MAQLPKWEHPQGKTENAKCKMQNEAMISPRPFAFCIFCFALLRIDFAQLQHKLRLPFP